MDRVFLKKVIYVILVVLGLWLGVRYLLPVGLPFLLGALLALAAEPLVSLASKKMKRSWAAGLGVSVTLVLLVCVVGLVGALAVKEVALVTDRLPDVQKAARQGLSQVQQWLQTAAEKAPQSVRGLLQQTVDSSFADGTALMEQVTERIPGAVTGVLTWIPKGTLTLFTGLLSAFMISARLPKFREKLSHRLPESWKQKYLPALRQLRHGLWGWLKAQLKLMLVTWAIVGLGLMLLRVDYGLLWAALIALVDAVPVLGTGTVMVPWALISFFQGKFVFGAGLLGIYGVALTVRTVLEPRLIGRQLGLDPLVTLIAFYAGFTLWGVAGMLLAPILAAAVGTVIKQKET